MNEQIVYLIRHGSPRYPVDQLGRKLVYGPAASLTDEGIVESKRLAGSILQREGAPFEILVTSPYMRAEQTAEILACVMGIDMVWKDNRLQDTRSTWEGSLVEDFMTMFYEGKTFDDPHTLETLEELGERMEAAYNEIMIQSEGKRIGIVSHGDPIRALWYRLYNPQAKYPSYPTLTKMIGLDAAEGLRLRINPDGRLEPNMEILTGELAAPCRSLLQS